MYLLGIGNTVTANSVLLVSLINLCTIKRLAFKFGLLGKSCLSCRVDLDFSCERNISDIIWISTVYVTTSRLTPQDSLLRPSFE